MHRQVVRPRLYISFRCNATDKRLTQSIDNSKVAAIYPQVLNALPEPDKIRAMLGQDINQRILEDVHYSIQSPDHDNLTERQSNIKLREMELYMHSIARLQSNKYALQFARDEKLLTNRTDDYVKSVNVPSRVNNRYERFLGMDFQKYHSLTLSEQKALKRDMLEKEENAFLEIQAIAHERRYKQFYKSIYLSFKNEYTRWANKKEYHRNISDGTYQIDEDIHGSQDSGLIIEDMHLQESQGNIDVTVPTIFKMDDIRDDKSNPWTKWSWLKRTIIYSFLLAVIALLLNMCINDYKRQDADGGFQGLYLGRTRYL